MASREVLVSGHVAAGPDDLWAIVSDFCGGWHPLIAEIRAERDPRGALIRAFRAHGEETLYREQLTYLSQSDRVLRYTLLEGIAGADAYDAEIRVNPSSDDGCEIEWRASITAPDGRIDAIAEGTRTIFEMGLAALRSMPLLPRPSGKTPPAETVPLNTILIDGEPSLSVIATPARPGPLLLFLHGIGGAASNWEAQLKATGGKLHSAALDLRGYGQSSLGPRQSTIEDYCADILRVADHFCADRLVLAGLSYGSWIATSLAMRHPERLSGLVLSGGCTGMSEASVEERDAFRQAREMPLDAGKTPADFAPDVVKVLVGPEADEVTREALRQSMAAIPTDTYRDALNCFTRPKEVFDFSRLTMPVLMMTGEHDRLAPPREIRGVAERIATQAPRPLVWFEVIPAAGHVCNVEKPEAYNRVLGDFLGEIVR